MQEECVGSFGVVLTVPVQIPQLVQVSGQNGRKEAFCRQGVDGTFGSRHSQAAGIVTSCSLSLCAASCLCVFPTLSVLLCTLRLRQ